jgi:hypothetical protein
MDQFLQSLLKGVEVTKYEKGLGGDGKILFLKF